MSAASATACALRRARVPRDRDPLRPVVGEQLEEHVREAEERVRREAVARRELLRQREKGAVGEVVAVDEEELGVPRRPVVELQLLSGEGLRRHRIESTQQGGAADCARYRRAVVEIVPVTEGEKQGAEALRDGGRVAHLVGALGEAPSRGRHAWVGLGDHSLAPGESPELLADVYAVAGARWVDGRLPDPHRRGTRRGAAAAAVLRARLRPGAGARVGAGARRGAFRAADRGDSPGAAGRHRAAPRRRRRDRRAPGRPARLVRRAGAAAGGAAGRLGRVPGGRDRGDPDRRARRDGTRLRGVLRGREPWVAHLPVAATRPDARSAGLGTALAEHALHEAHLAGFETVELDWRSTNLLASRFWPKRGFRATHLRLRRDVQPTA